MTNEMTAAQTAQQNNRDGAGKYSTKEVGESDVEIAAAWAPVKRWKALSIPGTLNTSQRLKWVGATLEARDILCQAGDEAQIKFGNDAHVLRYVEDDGVCSTFSVHSADETSRLGSVDVEGVFYDNGSDDLKVGDEVYSVAACAAVDIESDAGSINSAIAERHMRATTFDYTGMGPGDVDWAIEGLAGSEGFEEIEGVNSLSDEQYEALVDSMSQYEIPESALQRMNADFSEEVAEKLAEILK